MSTNNINKRNSIHTDVQSSMATAPDPAPVKQMEALLECSICMETLTEPRTLPCFHSFCKQCLTNFIATLKQAVKKGAKVPEVFECPVCRTNFHVKEGESIEKMPSNHFINSMLELLTLTQQSVKCESCKARSPATSRCISCEKYLCGKCLEAHNNWPDFDDHIVLTLEELAKPENRTKARGKPRCKKHDKVLKFYCETCKVLACRYCVDVNHPRPEHLWFPLADIVVQHKETLKASCAIFEQQTNEADQSGRKIKHAMATLKNNATKTKGAIIHQRKKILMAFNKLLDQEMAILLDQVDEIYKEANEALMRQQANVKDYREKAKSSLDFAKNIISSGSDEEILSFIQEVEEKTKSIKNERPVFMEPVHNCSIEYQAKKPEDVLENGKLHSLGKIGMCNVHYKISIYKEYFLSINCFKNLEFIRHVVLNRVGLLSEMI